MILQTKNRINDPYINNKAINLTMKLSWIRAVSFSITFWVIDPKKNSIKLFQKNEGVMIHRQIKLIDKPEDVTEYNQVVFFFNRIWQGKKSKH